MPEYLTTSQWGIGPHNAWERMRFPVSDLWVHHSVTKATRDPASDLRVLDHIAHGQGHDGISYSYAIHPSGTIGEGRGDYVGAHTYQRNSTSLGVCFIGNFENDRPTSAAIDSFRWLRDLLVLSKRLATHHYIGGHREVYPTACPGRHLVSRLDALRQPSPPKGVFMALSDKQQDELYARVHDIAQAMSGDKGVYWNTRYTREELLSGGQHYWPRFRTEIAGIATGDVEVDAAEVAADIQEALGDELAKAVVDELKLRL